GLEDLDAIVGAIANVKQAVHGKLGAMHGIAELLRRRTIRIVGTKVRIIRFVSVCAPMPFVLSSVGVEDDHAMIAIAIRDVDFIGLLVDKNLRRPAQILDVVAAFALAGLADLHEELSSLSEFEHHRVIGVADGRTGLFLILHLLSARPGPAACTSSAASRRGSDTVAADPDV